jgi:hypothetical protein
MPSATTITMRRFQRSTYAPARGERRISGIRATIVAVASTVAEPVNWVSHHTSANWTTLLPINEKACPVQMVKNESFQFKRSMKLP